MFKSLNNESHRSSPSAQDILAVICSLLLFAPWADRRSGSASLSSAVCGPLVGGCMVPQKCFSQISVGQQRSFALWAAGCIWTGPRRVDSSFSGWFWCSFLRVGAGGPWRQTLHPGPSSTAGCKLWGAAAYHSSSSTRVDRWRSRPWLCGPGTSSGSGLHPSPCQFPYPCGFLLWCGPLAGLPTMLSRFEVPYCK